ncbi:MAG: hypothetical protein V4737_01325, partial [Curtobacterium sp.]
MTGDELLTLSMPEDEQWVLVPTREGAGRSRRAPQRWAWRLTYRLYPWYTRPFRFAEVHVTSAVLERYCTFSTPQLRVAVIRSSLAPQPRPAMLAVGIDPPGGEPDDGLDEALHRGQRLGRGADGGAVTDLLNRANERVGLEYELPFDRNVVRAV